MTKPFWKFMRTMLNVVTCYNRSWMMRLFTICVHGEFCERNAKMLLMFAFAIEIADSVEVESLKARQYEMIQKRLSGELSLCDQCVLHCSHEKLLEFDIDNIFS